MPPSVTRLILIRHGEADANTAQIFGGPKSCTGLSDLGRKQCELLRDRLVRTGELAGAAALYCSNLPRARETAEIIAPALGLPVVEDPDLHELDPGEADGLHFEEWAEQYGAVRWDEDIHRPMAPGGESWAAFLDRAAGALIRLAETHTGDTIVAACHGGIVEASMIRLLGLTVEYRWNRFQTINTSLTEWSLRRDLWRLVRYNDAAHLTS